MVIFFTIIIFAQSTIRLRYTLYVVGPNTYLNIIFVADYIRLVVMFNLKIQ